MKVGFITEASESIGYGHLYRCIALAQVFKINNHPIIFFLESDDEITLAKELIPEATIISRKTLIHSDFINENLVEIVIIDIYPKTISEYYFTNSITAPFKVQILDAAFAYAMLEVDCYFKIGFQTYKSKIETVRSATDNSVYQFNGTDYLVFREEFKIKKDYKCRVVPENILITMGGSDPYFLTETVLEAIALMNTPLNVKIVIGSGFSSNRKTKLKAIVEKNRHNVTILHNVKNIAAKMKNSDMAIINGGNTRFELALIGVPFLSLSINQKQKEISDKVSEYGIGKSLGIYSDLSRKRICEEIEEFKNDFELRRRMSKLMREKIDNEGSIRIYDIILNQMK